MFFERAVGLAMTIRIGAGGARYRLGGPAGPVDTVHLRVFRRAALDAASTGTAASLQSPDRDSGNVILTAGDEFHPRALISGFPRDVRVMRGGIDWRWV